MTLSRYRIAIVGVAMLLSACLASTQQEVELGRQYAAQINEQLPIVQDAEISRYINALGNQIARAADDRGLEWQFYVVNDPAINAFAVPGGFIYVNRGLIERAATLSELAGVMGHEIAHVTERHSMERMRDADRANLGVTAVCVLTGVCEGALAGTAINVAAGAAFASFSRSDEEEADRVGISHVVRAGIHPGGVPTMFERLLAERNRNPSAVEGWFSSHPLEEDRIRSTRAIISGYDEAILDDLQRDSQAFQNFKRRVSQLPSAGR
jgi:predicted Zn-dependent protease